MSTHNIGFYGELTKISFNYHLIPTFFALSKFGLTASSLVKYRSWLESWNFVIMYAKK